VGNAFRSIVTICSGLYLLIGMTSFSSNNLVTVSPLLAAYARQSDLLPKNRTRVSIGLWTNDRSPFSVTIPELVSSS
jgi:hypothetical protein